MTEIHKKILQAFEEKNTRFIADKLKSGIFDPNAIIPRKTATCFHLIMGHPSEHFAFQIVRLFLRYGGDPNVLSLDGMTPAHIAAMFGRTRILHLLLVNGADPWILDDENKNCYNYAFELKEWETIELLHRFQVTQPPRENSEPKFTLDLDRVLLRNGEEVFEYVPDTKMDTKTTQTDVIVPQMVKFFESSPAKISPIKQSNQLCEKSCQIVVPVEVHRGEAQSFISSLHINTSDNSTNSIESKVMESLQGDKYINISGNSTNSTKSRFLDSLKDDLQINTSKNSTNSTKSSFLDSSKGDLRSQLFCELKEAVSSKLKLKATPKKVTLISGISNLEISPEEIKSKVRTSSPLAKEVSKENKTIDLFSPSLDLSLEELKDKVQRGQPLVEEFINENGSVDLFLSEDLRHQAETSWSLVEDKSKGNMSVENCLSSPCLTTYVTCEEDNSEQLESFLSVVEEYTYVDEEENVKLVERKLLVAPELSCTNLQEIIKSKEDNIGMESVRSSCTSLSSIPSTVNYDTDHLRTELTSLGYQPGPIMKSTKRLYLRKLHRMKKHVEKYRVNTQRAMYSIELEKTLKSEKYLNEIPELFTLEDQMSMSFGDGSKRRRQWREGNLKTSFNYLLLDSRTTQNLPKRATSLEPLSVWQCFLSAIFYVGKGKQSRPFSHLTEAYKFRNNEDTTKASKKVKRILDIWNDGVGVVCVHVFQNIIPVEAYTREAAMIDALGVTNLTNAKVGDYYGVCSTWRTKERLKLGVYLLSKAMSVFLCEGERQLRPSDVREQILF